jgi:hypothetical protein
VTTNDRNLPTFVFARIRSVAFLFDEQRSKSREKKRAKVIPYKHNIPHHPHTPTITQSSHHQPGFSSIGGFSPGYVPFIYRHSCPSWIAPVYVTRSSKKIGIIIIIIFPSNIFKSLKIEVGILASLKQTIFTVEFFYCLVMAAAQTSSSITPLLLALTLQIFFILISRLCNKLGLSLYTSLVWKGTA